MWKQKMLRDCKEQLSMRWTKNISFDTTKKKTEQTYSIKVVYYK